MLRLFSVAAATLLLSVSASAATVGAAAPAFSLVDYDGNTRTLSEFAGKTVVLEWANHGCPYVKKHYNSGNMQSLQKMATDKDVVWLMVCSSAPGTQGHLSAADWKAINADKGAHATTVLIDESGEVGKLYGAKTTPHMYVIDEDGILVYDGAIDSIASTRESDIAKAENYVMAAVNALLSGAPIENSKVKPYGCGVKYAR